MTGIYELVAEQYYQAGYSPLPAVRKNIIVKGVTGYHPLATQEQIQEWIRLYPRCDVALRLPSTTVALDIDAYKGDLDKLAVLERQLGSLPPTYNVDARGGVGGKILYKVPTAKWHSMLGGITIVQHTHRYVIAAPSWNRETESRYCWYKGLGGPITDEVPEIGELPALPDNWINALYETPAKPIEHSPRQSFDELQMFREGEPCEYMSDLINECVDELTKAYEAGLHDTGLKVIGKVVRAAANGHTGLQPAIDKLAQIFVSAPRNRDLQDEWDGEVSYVLAHIEAEDDNCACAFKLKMKNFFDQLRANGCTRREAAYLVSLRKGFA